MPSSLSPVVCAWFAGRHGVARHGDLLRLGVTRRQIEYLLATGILTSFARGVYRLTAAPRTEQQQAALACAVDRRVVISSTSAGRWWGLRRLGPDRGLQVTIPRRRNLVVPAAIVHRGPLEPGDIVERDDGIRLTSPPRTAFDLAAVLRDEALESVIEQLLHERLTTYATLQATGWRLGRRGRKGSARFARVLLTRPASLRAVGSDLELRFERAVLARAPEADPPGHDRAGRRSHRAARLPLARRREIVEIDHITWHGGKLDLAADHRRDRALRALGYRVTRVTDHEVATALDPVLDELAPRLLATRAS